MAFNGSFSSVTRAHLRWISTLVFGVTTCVGSAVDAAGIADDNCVAGKPCIVYFPGTGKATDAEIDGRVAEYRRAFPRDIGKEVHVKVIKSDRVVQIGDFSYRWYSDEALRTAIAFLNAHPGRDTHVIAVSAGDPFFREALSQIGNKQFGYVVEVEPMFPRSFAPDRGMPAGYDPLLHITLEKRYTGDLAQTFKDMFGVRGSLIPGCAPPGCYQIDRGTVELNSLFDFVSLGMNAHSEGVSSGETAAGSILTIGIRDQVEALKQRLKEQLIKPEPPGTPGSSPTGTPQISGGGGAGAAGGGGLGIESFPLWLDPQTYREQMKRVHEQRTQQ